MLCCCYKHGKVSNYVDLSLLYTVTKTLTVPSSSLGRGPWSWFSVVVTVAITILVDVFTDTTLNPFSVEKFVYMQMGISPDELAGRCNLWFILGERGSTIG